MGPLFLRAAGEEASRELMPRRKVAPTCRDVHGEESDIGCSMCNVTVGTLLPNTRTSIRALAADLRTPRSGEGVARRCTRVLRKNDRGAYLMLAIAIAVAILAVLRCMLRRRHPNVFSLQYDM